MNSDEAVDKIVKWKIVESSIKRLHQLKPIDQLTV